MHVFVHSDIIHAWYMDRFEQSVKNASKCFVHGVGRIRAVLVYRTQYYNR